MSQDKEIRYIYKPDKKTLEKGRAQLEKIHKIVKDKKIPYMSSEEIADLLKDRDHKQLSLKPVLSNISAELSRWEILLIKQNDNQMRLTVIL